MNSTLIGNSSNSLLPDQPFTIINVEDDGDFFIFFPLGQNNRSLALNLTDTDAATSPRSDEDFGGKVEFNADIARLFQHSFKLRSSLSERKKLNKNNKKKDDFFASDEEFWYSHLTNFLPYVSDKERPFSVVPASLEIPAGKDFLEKEIAANLGEPKKVVQSHKDSNFIPRVVTPFQIDVGSGFSNRGKSLTIKNEEEVTADKIDVPLPLLVDRDSNDANKIVDSGKEILKHTDGKTQPAKSTNPKLDQQKIDGGKSPVNEADTITIVGLHTNGTGVPLPLLSGDQNITDASKGTSDVIIEKEALNDVDYVTEDAVKDQDYLVDYSLNDNEYDDAFDHMDVDYLVEDPANPAEEIDTFDVEDFDPVNFGLPKLNMEELSDIGGIPPIDHRIGSRPSLRMDNKTATFIFILLNSLSDVINFNNTIKPPQSSELGLRTNSPQVNSFLHSFDNKLLNPSSLTSLNNLTLPIPFNSSNRGRVFSKPSNSEKSTFVRLFQEVLPSMSSFCQSEVTCEEASNDYCLEDSDYPVKEMRILASGDENIFSKYAEVTQQSADDLVSLVTKDHEESFNYSSFNPGAYDKTHWFGPEGYVCPSQVTYSKPTRAQNARGEWRILLNDGDVYTQTLRMELCLFPKTPCRLVAPCFKSKCLQKYTYHRLLAFDPCQPSKGLHVDIFRLPSACSCYAPAFTGFGDSSIDEFL